MRVALTIHLDVEDDLSEDAADSFAADVESAINNALTINGAEEVNAEVVDWQDLTTAEGGS